jgi:hypothetical protein
MELEEKISSECLKCGKSCINLWVYRSYWRLDQNYADNRTEKETFVPAETKMIEL